MIEKINLKGKVNTIDSLFTYLRVGKSNNHILSVLQTENRKLDFHVHKHSKVNKFGVCFIDKMQNLKQC